jgi:hypothetical protein
MLDQVELIRDWSSSLLGGEADISLTACEPEELLGWTAAVEDEAAEIEVLLEESGWGTKVSLCAESASELADFEPWAEAFLEELANPSRRPFSSDERDEHDGADEEPEDDAAGEDGNHPDGDDEDAEPTVSTERAAATESRDGPEPQRQSPSTIKSLFRSWSRK